MWPVEKERGMSDAGENDNPHTTSSVSVSTNCTIERHRQDFADLIDSDLDTASSKPWQIVCELIIQSADPTIRIRVVTESDPSL